LALLGAVTTPLRVGPGQAQTTDAAGEVRVPRAGEIYHSDGPIDHPGDYDRLNGVLRD
jgi:hypothetical protein